MEQFLSSIVSFCRAMIGRHGTVPQFHCQLLQSYDRWTWNSSSVPLSTFSELWSVDMEQFLSSIVSFCRAMIGGHGTVPQFHCQFLQSYDRWTWNSSSVPLSAFAELWSVDMEQFLSSIVSFCIALIGCHRTVLQFAFPALKSVNMEQFLSSIVSFCRA